MPGKHAGGRLLLVASRCLYSCQRKKLWHTREQDDVDDRHRMASAQNQGSATPDSNRGPPRLTAARGSGKLLFKSITTVNPTSLRTPGNNHSHLPLSDCGLALNCDCLKCYDRFGEGRVLSTHHVTLHPGSSTRPLFQPDLATPPDPPLFSPRAPLSTAPHLPHGEREQAHHRDVHASAPSAGHIHDPIRRGHRQR